MKMFAMMYLSKAKITPKSRKDPDFSIDKPDIVLKNFGMRQMKEKFVFFTHKSSCL
jgi:hypothetical protein